MTSLLSTLLCFLSIWGIESAELSSTVFLQPNEAHEIMIEENFDVFMSLSKMMAISSEEAAQAIHRLEIIGYKAGEVVYPKITSSDHKKATWSSSGEIEFVAGFPTEALFYFEQVDIVVIKNSSQSTASIGFGEHHASIPIPQKTNKTLKRSDCVLKTRILWDQSSSVDIDEMRSTEKNIKDWAQMLMDETGYSFEYINDNHSTEKDELLVLRTSHTPRYSPKELYKPEVFTNWKVPEYSDHANLLLIVADGTPNGDRNRQNMIEVLPDIFAGLETQMNAGTQVGFVFFDDINRSNGTFWGNLLYNEIEVFDAMDQEESTILILPKIENCVNSEAQIRVSPNPVTDELRLEYIGSEDLLANIEITNSVGQSVLNISSMDKIHLIDVSRWSSGVYFIRIEGSSALSFIKN